MLDKPPGTVFEVDGKWYVIVDQGKKVPHRAERLNPQPVDLPAEYIHEDGQHRICANMRCSNLVPKSKNPGVRRIYCSDRCAVLVIQRKHDAKRRGGEALLRDPLNRLYAIVLRRPQSVKKARELLYQHLDGLYDRCPEATEASNFQCSGRFNQYCYSEATWQRYHQGGPWPGVCLIYATLKDHYKINYYAERMQNTERDYTIGRGEHWHWKNEAEMLPYPEGIARP